VLALRSVARATSVTRSTIDLDDSERDADAVDPAHEHALLREHIVAYRLDGALFFGAAQRFLAELSQVADVRVVILRLPQLQVLDATGANAVAQIVEDLERRGVTVLLKGVRAEHERVLRAVGAYDRLATDRHVFERWDDALAHARAHVERGRAEDVDEAQPPAKATRTTVACQT
jgi:SulP family sulfate permease